MSVAYQISVGDTPAVSLQLTRLTLPLRGVWTADLLSTDPSTAASFQGQPVAIGFGGLSLVGTILRGGNWRASAYLRVVGGAGGLANDTTPSGYANITAQMLLSNLLDAVGETLSTASSIPATTFATYVQRREPTSLALTRIANKLKLHWRVLVDGTVWFGTETWPAATLTDPVLIDSYPERGELLVGITQPELVAGTNFTIKTQGGNVSDVEYNLKGSGIYRMRVYLEDPDTSE